MSADPTDYRDQVAHTPDGVFALERNGVAALFFLEIDRGTEVLTNPSRGFLKIVRFCLSLLAFGGYQRYQSDFGVSRPFRAFRTLIVSPSPARVENMRKRCGSAADGPDPAKHFLWLTTADAVLDEALLDRPWVSLDPEDTRTYRLRPATG